MKDYTQYMKRKVTILAADTWTLTIVRLRLSQTDCAKSADHAAAALVYGYHI